jgi:Mg2+-importing ATPase
MKARLTNYILTVNCGSSSLKFRSLPGKFLSIATVFVLLLVLILSLTPLSVWFGFKRLPISYYGWTLLIITL